MSDDLQQFDKIFFEEMSEHLEEMESMLLNMHEGADNVDAFDAVFRSAHSIKGGAGIFGYEDICSVTHILESLLDRLRDHQLTLNQEMIEVFLLATDLLGALKESHQFDDVDPIPPYRVSDICKKLKKLSGDLTITDHQSQVTGAAKNEQTPRFITNTPLTQEMKATIKILLVEDIKVNQMVATFTLKKLGFNNIQVSENGQQAIEQLNAATSPFALILLDCQMPVMDGYETSKAIRRGDAGEINSSIPIIAMTAMAGDKEEKNCLDAGMDDYLVKPIEATSVDEKIQYWLNTKKSIATKSATANHKPIKEKKHEANSIRVNTEKVDQLINQVGELIITQSMLQKLSIDLGLNDNPLLASRLNQLESNTRDLQASVMAIRMMPIITVFNRFPRIIRDLSVKLDKNIKLVIEGEQTELDKRLLEMLVDPLTHLIRNSIDHGIESPVVRSENNKPEQGTITLTAYYRGDEVIVNVQDDGAGIDPDKIKHKALEKGIKLLDNISDNDVFQLIFEPGFSLAEKVTDVSGRGVGMDVVKRNISSMGGRIEINSQLGIGSTISIHLPLTLAIIEGMSVAVGDHVYIIPLNFIVESLQPHHEEVDVLNGGQVMILVHKHYIPVLALHQFFNIQTAITKIHEGIVILLEHDGKTIALFVDRLIGQQQVVIKNLETNFRKVPSVSGATIMGDGRISLILDVADLVKQC